MSYRCFGRARSLRSDRALARAWSLRSDRVLARDRSLLSDRAPARVRSLRSDRAFARSLRSDRAEWTFGRYVATEPWLKLGRYGPNSEFLLAGTWSVPLSGTQGSGSCLEAGGNDTGQAPLRQDPVTLVLLSWVPLKPELILSPAGESRRDDTGDGFLEVPLVFRVPRIE
ncbi:hypothetical protein DY000_02022321 [Brassica cretica]|uniref:Uncharacterized protein n=1 Tax=Brassica cretica TaxID=69181 RepID=A0ABQ7EHF1_BRACR|nr:hypothetical protein DY000_02022321 [Brassica cretica]